VTTGRWALGQANRYHPRRLPLEPVLIDRPVAEPADGWRPGTAGAAIDRATAS
jgi:hypothetical protein